MIERTVLHCIPTMEGGGAERQLAYLAGALPRFGWRVHVALMRRGPNWDRLEASGAQVHELRLRSAYDWHAVGALRGVVREVRPALVQVWLLQMEVLGGLAALSSGTPWVFSERSSARAYPTSAKTLLRQGMARLASAIVSNSSGGDAYWRSRVGRDMRRHVIPNALPLDEIAAAPPASDAELGTVATAPIVLFAGRFGEEKNVVRLLAALDLVLARTPAQVVLFGQGPLQAAVDAWAARARGAGRCVVVGGYTARLWSAMKRAAVVVSPSVFEGSPNVVLEAMACAAPLVVSDIPQHRELLDERAATFAPVDSVAGLADGILRVLLEPPAARARADVAQGRAAAFGVDVVAGRYAAVYREVLADTAG